jgi:UTP--glucose-1-phosphate uridylyltransferase
MVFLTLSSDWDRIKSPADDKVVPYAKLPKTCDTKNLNKLAVLKVNGGLGTSMGVFDPNDS